MEVNVSCARQIILKYGMQEFTLENLSILSEQSKSELFSQLSGNIDNLAAKCYSLSMNSLFAIYQKHLHRITSSEGLIENWFSIYPDRLAEVINFGLDDLVVASKIWERYEGDLHGPVFHALDSSKKVAQLKAINKITALGIHEKKLQKNLAFELNTEMELPSYLFSGLTRSSNIKHIFNDYHDWITANLSGINLDKYFMGLESNSKKSN